MNVESTLEIMNVSKFSSEMAFVVIQQPGVIIRTLVIAMGEYIIPKKDEGKRQDVLQVEMIAIIQIFLLETILICSLITTRLSYGSILKSTQVGGLVQYILLAFYYMTIDRLQVDLFNLQSEEQMSDFMIYLSLFLIFFAIYMVIICWTEINYIIKNKCCKRTYSAEVLEA